MGSYAEYVAGRAGVPLLHAASGETDEAGQFAAATYLPEMGNEQQFGPIIVTQAQIQAEIDPDTGGLRRREQRTLRARRETLAAVGIDAPHVAGQVRLPDGSEWSIDAGASVWGAAMVTLGLARKVLVRQHESRRADI